MRIWQELIENALANDKFLLSFQPVFCIDTGAIGHYQCSVRLLHENGDILLPSQFIDYAEQIEIISKIDRWVIKNAIKKLASLQNNSRQQKLIVNISSACFGDKSFIDEIIFLIANSSIDPKNIIFQIAELAAISNFAIAKMLFSRLKNLGCLVALGNFGAGDSSIYYLKRLPVDFIKLDGTFISKIHLNDDDKVFVKAVTGLAHAFNKKVVADHVESYETLNILKDFKVDFAQGNWLGKPLMEI